VHGDAGDDLAIALDDLQLAAVVERHHLRELLDIRGAAERLAARVGPRPERHLVLLDPVFRVRKQAVPGPVVIMQVRDQRDRDVVRLHARDLLHHRRRPHVVADAALLRIVLEEPGVDEHGMRPAEDQPHEVVEREGRMLLVAVEELARLGVAFAVLERVDLVHGSPRWRGVYYRFLRGRMGRPAEGRRRRPTSHADPS
jgi:hypothetical protein